MWETINVINQAADLNVKVGKAQNGCVNMILNFNAFDHIDFLQMLQADANIESIISVSNYAFQFSNLSIRITPWFSYESFSNNLENYFNENVNNFLTEVNS